MIDLRDAAQQALEAWEHINKYGFVLADYDGPMEQAITALKAALEQPEQAEPVTTPPCKGMNCGAIDGRSHSLECHAEHSAAIAGGRFVPLPRREWRGLTVPEMVDLWRTATGDEFGGVERFARAIEAALKEKNHE